LSFSLNSDSFNDKTPLSKSEEESDEESDEKSDSESEEESKVTSIEYNDDSSDHHVCLFCNRDALDSVSYTHLTLPTICSV